MAETALLFKPTLTQIDQLILDACVSEQHSRELEVTDHQVEDGTNISDHARLKPDGLTIEGVISNNPINRTQTRRVVNSLGVSFETSAQEDQATPGSGYAERAFSVLRDLQDTKKLITVVTSLKTYDNMILVSLSVPRNSRQGTALYFTAQFKLIKFVKNKTTTVTVTREPRGKGKVDTGKQSTTEASSSEGASKRKTWAKSLGDSSGLSGLLGVAP